MSSADLSTLRRTAASAPVRVACVPLSSIARQRNARAIALTMALSIRRQGVAQVSVAPSGARTSFLPPRVTGS
jgi:hypothetical protein